MLEALGLVICIQYNKLYGCSVVVGYIMFSFTMTDDKRKLENTNNPQVAGGFGVVLVNANGTSTRLQEQKRKVFQ